jgi:hypothetical protein
MSMEVDFTKPLTADERKFLESRGRYSDIERADAASGVSTEYSEGDGTGPVQRALLTSEAAAERREQLLAELALLDTVEGVSDAPDGEDGEVQPYDQWELPELKAEIDRRNEGRAGDSKIAKTGNVQVLADRLYADDEASAQQA